MDTSDHKRHNDQWDEKYNYEYLCEEQYEENLVKVLDLVTRLKMWLEAEAGVDGTLGQRAYIKCGAGGEGTDMGI